MTEDELAHVYMSHKKAVIGVVRGQYKGINTELLHDLYTDLWFTLTQLQTVRLRTLRGFLITALSNKLKNHLRSMKQVGDALGRETISLHDPGVLERAEQLNKTYQVVDSQPELPSCEYMLGDLPVSLQYVAWLHFVEGWTQDEIATDRKVSRQWVNKLVQEARERIKQKYINLGFGLHNIP